MLPNILANEIIWRKPVKMSPSVTILLPFNPKMSGKSNLQHSIKKAIDMAGHQLLQAYPALTAGLIVDNLLSMAASLDYSTYKTSIAMVISAGVGTVHYLDIEVMEKIIIQPTFDIRNIVLNKQYQQDYLLLILSGKQANLFLGAGSELTPLIKDNIYQIEGHRNEISKPAPYSAHARPEKEKFIRKYMLHVDDGLSIILKAYPLPLFLACTEKTMGNFKKVSKSMGYVVEYIPGDYENAT